MISNRGLPEYLSHQCSLSLLQLHSHPRFVFVSRVLCWSVCGCRVCVHLYWVHVSVVRCSCRSWKRHNKPQGRHLQHCFKNIWAWLSRFPSCRHSVSGGRTVGRPVWEGAQQTHLGRNNAGQETKNPKTDAIARTDGWREICKHTSGGNSRLFTAVMLKIGKRSLEAWQVH